MTRDDMLDWLWENRAAEQPSDFIRTLLGRLNNAELEQLVEDMKEEDDDDGCGEADDEEADDEGVDEE